VRNVSELQDIDELCVVEASADTVLQMNGDGADGGGGGGASASEIAPQEGGNGGTPMMMGRAASGSHHQRGAASGALATSTLQSLADEAAHKYVKRANPLRRALQRLLPSLFAPGLPVTMRYLFAFLCVVHACGCSGQRRPK
jgi:hypothetical protein